MDNIVLCGMQFGDEGKGTFVDYLTHKENAKYIVKYNGGSQASHTVITPDGILHKFSQLGSGMFSKDCHTFLDQNMVISLENLVVEIQEFSKKTGIPFSDIRDRIHIHEDCYIVTPYHKLANKLRELSLGTNRRGSVGTGVSEVRYLLSISRDFPPLGLTVKDIYNYYSNSQVFSKFNALQEYVSEFYRKNKDTIWKNAPDNIKDNLSKEINFLLGGASYFKIASGYIRDFKFASHEVTFRNCVYNYHTSDLYEKTIFEGSQGLLIDSVYGIKPNTTLLDTTNSFARGICEHSKNTRYIGIAKAFFTRHGMGLFPTEDFEMSQKISDENQEKSFWNGAIRFGWFDVVLLKYAQDVNQVDKLYLSSIDKLDNFEKIKICTAYTYTGDIDQKFKSLFDYTISSNGLVTINSIKAPDIDIGKYLKKCSPIYCSVDGWMSDTSHITDCSGLPENCLNYIKLLGNLCGIPVSLISVGPTRKNKIQIC